MSDTVAQLAAIAQLDSKSVASPHVVVLAAIVDSIIAAFAEGKVKRFNANSVGVVAAKQAVSQVGDDNDATLRAHESKIVPDYMKWIALSSEEYKQAWRTVCALYPEGAVSFDESSLWLTIAPSKLDA